SELGFGRLEFALRQCPPEAARHVARPEHVLLERGLLPRWIPDDHIEAWSFAQEYLWERDREVEGVEPAKSFCCSAVLLGSRKSVADVFPFLEVYCYRLVHQTRRGDEVAECRRRRHRCECHLLRLACPR